MELFKKNELNRFNIVLMLFVSHLSTKIYVNMRANFVVIFKLDRREYSLNINV